MRLIHHPTQNVPQMAHQRTSEADKGTHMAEHVARGDGAEALDVGHRQAGDTTEPKHPQRQHEGGADDQLDGTDAPGEGDREEGTLMERVERTTKLG